MSDSQTQFYTQYYGEHGRGQLVTNHRKTGSEYELRAERFLESRGYRIVERNYRIRQAEIDLIAYDGGVLCFIEVKYRSSEVWGDPGESINAAKQGRIRRAAQWYCAEKNLHDCPCRFDAVLIAAGRYRLVKDAF